jgi:hypothetical protein
VQLAVQVPFDEQVSPAGHVPHDPPQPSLPHIFPAQLAVQPVVQAPDVEHVSPVGQLPHVPPHPSGPHSRPLHTGSQWPASPLPPVLPHGGTKVSPRNTTPRPKIAARNIRILL